MIRLFFPMVGIALLIVGALATRTLDNLRARVYGYLSSLAGMVCLCLWWPENSLLLDRMLHVVGLGRVISYTMGSLAFVLEVEWILALTGAKLQSHRRGLLLYWALILISVPMWIVAAQLPLSNLETRFNDGYFGRPWPLLALNVILGLEIFWGCLLAARTFWYVYRETPDRAEAPLAAGFAVAGLVVSAFGVSIIAQTCADALGFGATGLWRYRGLFVGTAACLLIVTVLGAIFAATPTRRLSMALSLRRQKAEIWSVLRDMRHFQIMLSERLVFLNPFVDTNLVDAILKECAAAGLDAYTTSIAKEVGRWVSFYRGEILSKPQLLGSSLSVADADRHIAADAWRRAEGNHFFYGDVYIVVGLLLGPDLMPAPINQRIRPEHRRLAALLQKVIAAHAWSPRHDIDSEHPLALAVNESLTPLLQRDDIALLPCSVSRAFAAYCHDHIPVGSDGRVDCGGNRRVSCLQWDAGANVSAFLQATCLGNHSHVAIWWDAESPCVLCALPVALEHLRAACAASMNQRCYVFGVAVHPSGIEHAFRDFLEADALHGRIIAVRGCC